jgi:putative phosphoribosyl transferase
MSMFELPELRDRENVFEDRTDAGVRLAELIAAHERPRDPLVLALPAGGVPVAAPVAAKLAGELDVAVASKITPPWNTEMGYGAIAFDGSVVLNEGLVRRVGLDREEVARGIANTRAKVERRVRSLRADRGPFVTQGRTAIVVDDGIASGFTLRVVLSALQALRPARLLVAVPTAPQSSVQQLEGSVDAFYVANVRTGASFAVASAYRRWCDVDEEEALAILAREGKHDDRRLGELPAATR